MFPLRDVQPSYSRPFVTICIIVVNVLVFLYEASLDDYSLNAFISVYGLTPIEFNWTSVLTSMFLHGGWMHLIGNMWFLWIFGDNIEDILGRGKYVLFYLLSGVAAAMAQYAINADSRVPMVGASGAIAGVMGAYMIKFPHARIESVLFVFFFLTRFDVPAWLMLIYWFATQLFSGVGSIGVTQASEGGTAFFAHIGGFVAGMILLKLLRTRERYSRRRDVYW
jgi:membrane associated rhomboid family serine protease